MWGNLAALARLRRAAARRRARAARSALRPSGRTGWCCCWSSAAAAAIVLADLSRMSKAEVERIWLPFVPWLMLSTALLPERWRRLGLAVQVVSALLVQQLLYTSW